MDNSTKKYFFVIAILIAIFSIYNYIVYTSENYSSSIPLSEEAMHGQRLWQENNCWSCHQFYGLGGYLGPDLTNIYSDKNKGPAFVKAFLNTGVKSMPKFDFSEEEKEALIEYLRVIDKTGYFPNYKATIDRLGWVKIEYKNEE